MATEKEKMIRGELYDAMDPTLVTERRVARELLRLYHQYDAYDERGAEILFKLFGSIGPNCVVEQPFRCDYGNNIQLGEQVFINFNCVFLDVTEIRIGNRVLLGPGVQLYAATHPIDPKVRQQGLEYGKPIVIEDDAWIGGNTTILPGVRVGHGAVVGAGSVVTKDVPPMTVYAGNPAKFIKNIPQHQDSSRS